MYHHHHHHHYFFFYYYYYYYYYTYQWGEVTRLKAGLTTKTAHRENKGLKPTRRKPVVVVMVVRRGEEG